MNIHLTSLGEAARLRGLITEADAGTGNSRLQFFSTTQPGDDGGSPGGSPISEIALAKPSASVVDGALVLQPLNVAGDLIALNGNAKWGRWISAAGDVLLHGDVTDASGDGFFKVSGTEGVALRAGGRALLGESEIT